MVRRTVEVFDSIDGMTYSSKEDAYNADDQYLDKLKQEAIEQGSIINTNPPAWLKYARMWSVTDGSVYRYKDPFSKCADEFRITTLVCVRDSNAAQLTARYLEMRAKAHRSWGYKMAECFVNNVATHGGYGKWILISKPATIIETDESYELTFGIEKSAKKLMDDMNKGYKEIFGPAEVQTTTLGEEVRDEGQ